jgi:ABC-2 type transport system permease protein
MGYANVDTLFILAPWVFLFLIPAVTMRTFADENKSGTIELLLTKPVTDFQIVLAKFFAGIVLVLLALLPTIIFPITIYFLGNPIGNIDIGAIVGSYIGLIFLSGAYVAIGIFSSAITKNQIISFLTSVFICFFLFQGFDSLSILPFLQNIDFIIVSLGINEHYLAMSKGVIDTRDVTYFISLISLFLIFTKLVLESRKW